MVARPPSQPAGDVRRVLVKRIGRVSGRRAGRHQVRLTVRARVLAGRVFRCVPAPRRRYPVSGGRRPASGGWVGVARGVIEMEGLGRDGRATGRSAPGRGLCSGRDRGRVADDRGHPYRGPGGGPVRGVDGGGHSDALGVLGARTERERARLVAPRDVPVEVACDRRSPRADGKRGGSGRYARRRARARGQHERLGEPGAHRERGPRHLEARVAGIPLDGSGAVVRASSPYGSLARRSSSACICCTATCWAWALRVVRPEEPNTFSVAATPNDITVAAISTSMRVKPASFRPEHTRRRPCVVLCASVIKLALPSPILRSRRRDREARGPQTQRLIGCRRKRLL